MTDRGSNDGNASLGSRVARLVRPFASRRPVPAAGAGAAWSVAMGAALALMSIRHAESKLAPRTDKRLDDAKSRLEGLMASATRALDEDCGAVGELLEAAREREEASPDETGEADSRLQLALRRASEAPLAILEQARDAMAALESVAGQLDPTVACEVITAAGLLYTGAESAVSIVRQNVRGLKDREAGDELIERAGEAMSAARSSHARISAATDEPD